MEYNELIRIFVEMAVDIAEHKATEETTKEDIIQATIEALEQTLA